VSFCGGGSPEPPRRIGSAHCVRRVAKAEDHDRREAPGPVMPTALWAERRAFRRLPATIAFDDAFAIAQGRIGIGQHAEEARWLFERVQTLSPKVVVEIGVSAGGTLFLWTRAAAADALLVGVDAREAGRLGRYSSFPLVRRAFATGGQRVELLLGVDSHAAATVDRVKTLIGDGPIDFLFVDGDHTYEGVRADTQRFGPLVRTNGLVAFHDVSANAAPWTEGVVRFWSEFSTTRPVEEFAASIEPGFGIGLYRVQPGEDWSLD
jgi:predicted O-methyltransferase YrrM